MPHMFQPTPAKSLFDGLDEDKQREPQANPASSSSRQATQDPYTSSRKATLDPEISSVFTQSTLGPSESIHQENTSSSRFGFLRRNKSKTEQQQQTALLGDGTTEQAKERKKSRFENPFKPHEQTDEDRAIMEKMRQRLGSREEAIKQGGAQPAGFRGVGGAQAMAMPWNGSM
ncbi:hypothetical protein KCU81_g8711, partial [Aureobasidium melanogenum]|uniref:Uncharacterized protein n=1 Tax=Aureobasidium melanogenum (strain CBS 110374) TaxID=1043003 RepID=A0A074W089_AURM1